MARKLKFEEYEGAMAKAQLQKIEMYAAKLNEMIHPDDELEGWVQNKLSVVAAYMGDVKHYLDYALKNEFGDGGMAPEKPRHWEVEFTWDGADEESRKVNVMADSVSEAEEQVRMKFGPYYKGLKVVEVEEDKEMTWEEYETKQKVRSLLNQLRQEIDDDKFDEISDKIHQISDNEGLSEKEYDEWDELRSENNKKRISKKFQKKFEIESTTDYDTIEADDEDDAREKWMKRRSGDSIKSEIVSVKRKFSDGGKTDGFAYFLSAKPVFIKELNDKAEQVGAKLEYIETDEIGRKVYRSVLNEEQIVEMRKLPIQIVSERYRTWWEENKERVLEEDETNRMLKKKRKRYDDGGMMKLESSTIEEDMKEAEDYIGREQWNSLSEQDKVNATQYLKAKGKIGYYGQEDELMDVLSAEAYRSGGSIYRGMRPSPSVSATAYPEGHRMMGNDGNLWEIAINTAGTHRWVRVHGEKANYSLEREKVRKAIEILESMRGDIDVDDEIAALKKTLK